MYLSNSEILKYIFNNFHKFVVSDKESQKVLRERRMIDIQEAEKYILNLFKRALYDIKDGKNDCFIFSISANTTIIIYNQYYFHIQIYDEETRRAEFIIKSLRISTDFQIHDYKNQGLTITNHILNRYMQYFKKFILWKDKDLHQDNLEKELMIKLKNGKKIFSRELTDTVYMVVDDMYFVMKKKGKNTISLVTMRPYQGILELPRGLKKIIKHSSVYTNFFQCCFCNKIHLEGADYKMLHAKDNVSAHKNCLTKNYKHSNPNTFEKHGKLYLKVLENVPKEFINESSLENMLDGALEYIKSTKSNITQSTDNLENKEVEIVSTNCVSCNMLITNDKFYKRNCLGERIHITCAKQIVNIKNTEKIFIHSGLSGLKATAKQRKEQLTNYKEEVKQEAV